LNIIQISDLLHSTFHNPIREYEDIAVIIFKKTLGNPFFIHEFLKVAHKRSDKTLFYDHVGGRWCWSVIKLNQISTSGNVASLLIDSLDQQSNETQRILQWAACIGSEFNENILSLVAKSSEWNIKKHLNFDFSPPPYDIHKSSFDKVMEEINRDHEDIGTKISDLMFVFDNLIDLDDRGFQSLLREVSTDKLVIALKGADEELAGKFLKNMSQRASEMLEEDMEAQGPLRVSDVESAQKEILAIARKMEEDGEIMLSSGGADDFI